MFSYLDQEMEGQCQEPRHLPSTNSSLFLGAEMPASSIPLCDF